MLEKSLFLERGIPTSFVPVHVDNANYNDNDKHNSIHTLTHANTGGFIMGWFFGCFIARREPILAYFVLFLHTSPHRTIVAESGGAWRQT